MTRAALGLAVALLCVACAKLPHVEPGRNDLYVLLPGADGKVGALSVTHAGKEAVLDQPHAAAKISRPGALEATTVTEALARETFGPALAAQPPRPTSFVLFFLHDSDTFTPESQQLVTGVLNEISRRPAPEIVVIGHTDTMGTDEYNDTLSHQRAERVAGMIRGRLEELRISSQGVQAAGRGKRELLVPTPDQVAEPRNRRVEIVVR